MSYMSKFKKWLKHTFRSAAEKSEPSEWEIDRYMKAARNGEMIEVRAFVKKYPDHVDIADYKTTALLLAIREGHEEMQDFLAAAGANVNIRFKDGTTLLMQFTPYGLNENRVQGLQKLGANPFLRTRYVFEDQQYTAKQRAIAEAEDSEGEWADNNPDQPLKADRSTIRLLDKMEKDWIKKVFPLLLQGECRWLARMLPKSFRFT